MEEENHVLRTRVAAREAVARRREYLHTLRGCTSCGNGVRNMYAVHLGEDGAEVLCPECTRIEINGLREMLSQREREETSPETAERWRLERARREGFVP